MVSTTLGSYVNAVLMRFDTAGLVMYLVLLMVNLDTFLSRGALLMSIIFTQYINFI